MASNPPLTELGREQARLTSEFMRGFKIDAFFASPLDRAYNTAEIIAQPPWQTRREGAGLHRERLRQVGRPHL